MKIKCENVVICGNYKCVYNDDGMCAHNAVAMDATGKCVVARPKPEKKTVDNA